MNGFFGIFATVGLILSLAGSKPAAAQCRTSLNLADSRSDQLLLQVPLSQTAPAFTLSYLHSVYSTKVTAHYQVRDGAIIQVSEQFSQPGYGMGATTQDDSVQAVTRKEEFIQLQLERLIPNFVLRIQIEQENRLEYPMKIDLGSKLKNRAVRLTAEQTCKPNSAQGAN